MVPVGFMYGCSRKPDPFQRHGRLMLPKGLFGVVSSGMLNCDEIKAFVLSRCSDDERFHFIQSPGADCMLGIITSTLYPYRFALSSSPDKRMLGVIDGVCFSPSRLVSQPHRLMEPNLSLPGEANGMFNCAAWDGKRLRLLSDPLSSTPVYYRRHDGRFVFSSSLELLARFPGFPVPEYSPDGMAQFLCWHAPLDGTTVFEHIFRLRGAELLDYESDTGIPQRRTYWTARLNPDHGTASLARAVEAFTKAVDRSVKVSPSPVCAALTGGLDSRTTWAVLLSGRHKVDAVTHAMLPGHDVCIAARIASTHGITHHVQWIREDYMEEFSRHVSELVRRTSGMIAADNAHLPYIYTRQAPYTATTIDGVNTHLERAWLLRSRAKRAKTKERLADLLWVIMYKPGILSLMDDDTAFEMIARAKRCLYDLVPDPADQPSPVAALDMFSMTHLLQNFGTNAVCLQNHYNRFITPYFDLDYIEAVSEAPENLRTREAVQVEIMNAHCPSLLDVPRSYSDVKTFGGKSMSRRLVPLILHKALARANLNHSPVLSRIDSHAPTMSYDHLLRAIADDNGEELTSRNTFLEPDKLHEYLAECAREGSNDATTLLRLLTMLHPESPLQPLMHFPRPGKGTLRAKRESMDSGSSPE